MIRRTALLTTAMLAYTSGALAADLSEDRVNELIEQFLRNNPNVVIESLQNYQIKQEAERVTQQTEAVKDVVKELKDNDEHHFGVAGNEDGDVLIVEFFDYNCPACKVMFESLDELMKEDKDVKVLFVEYPIFGPQSDTNAKLGSAVAALEPDKYYDFHTAMMRNKGRADEAFTLGVAKKLGIDPDELKKEAAKPEYDAIIEKDRELAAKLLIQGTPAIIVGNKMANGALKIDQLREYVKWAREDGE